MRAPKRAMVGLVAAAMGASSPASAAEPEAASTEVDGEGVSVPGVVLAVAGACIAGAGATLLVVDAAKADEEAIDEGADPGLEGSRGRAGQLPAEEDETLSTVGAVMLGGGALLHLVGIVIVFSGGDDDPAEPAQAKIEPFVAPGFGGLRGAF